MKKTKNFKKKRIIVITTIIVLAIVARIIAAKTYDRKGGDDLTTNTNRTTTNSTTHEGIISLEIVGPEEEPKDEQRSYAPGEIKEISEKDGTTYLTLDMLTLNPEFQPGVTDYFLNKNPKLRDLEISNKTKAFNCEDNTPTVSVPVADVIATIQQSLANANGRLTYFFDIEDGKINTIYQQCLP